MDGPEKCRLDRLLVSRGLVPSRSRAQDLIRQGHVLVAGKPVAKCGLLLDHDSDVRLDDAAWSAVSRGALKLRAALDNFGFEAMGRVALDIGASTGGFTEVLLDAGARRVYAVDVGRDQLHPKLRRDPRVVVLQGRDARRLGGCDIPEKIGAIVADVSFISLTKALAVPLSFASPTAWLIALVKPQFETGPGGAGKDGVVRSKGARARALAGVEDWLRARPGWRVTGAIPSPIEGRGGNAEFLIAAERCGP